MMSHKKARMGRSRDFGTEGAGKGDSDRTTNRDEFSSNYDLIDWGRKPKPDPAPFQPIPPAGFTPFPEVADDSTFGSTCVTNDIHRE